MGSIGKGGRGDLRARTARQTWSPRNVGLCDRRDLSSASLGFLSLEFSFSHDSCFLFIIIALKAYIY